MITVTLCKKTSGAFVSCEASGHAFFAPKGADIVCAAVTAVVRTVAATLAADERTPINAIAPTRGKLVFGVSEDGSCNEERLMFAADFLQKGLELIAAEYPKHVTVRVIITD